ncbi:MAG: DUF2059 domain-containing protein [Candidatus Tokpelaia sp.]|uniref:DUF2059 domain-containing protein n=1 Tax=Candidatus Tokpelaia sp. TaxID=2233777 RepID=UPI001239D9CD|nr:DUF2059 domain-containing protein [Candidatus Tokpelaia sp.]KAA6205576.1 MAG: DUF2059 domain-containing protein [Candidatus Tokpelaia sp.]KAA6207527.1 MAG: DUF2059 domain-containing protein [Candidatus Tokpelaia sp.]KAA6404696.1 hypothetical protein DPQ22_07095 [Candidatus Tokpelaia sp.]
MALSFFQHQRAWCIAAALTITGGSAALSPAAAQIVTPSHLQAAQRAIAAIHATDQFDSFLPDTALELKNELSQRDPNLAGLISKTVDEQAMLLVPRRADLEKEVARVYARHFTEAELNEIAGFYGSSTGKKLLKEGPASMAESVGAYDIWRQGVAQDLGAGVGKALDAKLNAESAGRQQRQNPGQTKDKPMALKFGQ